MPALSKTEAVYTPKPTVSMEEIRNGALTFLYRTTVGRLFLKLLTRPAVSRIVGRFMDSQLSIPFIGSFVRRNHIDLSDYEPVRYRSYNEFFTRRIRPELRPIDGTAAHLISPCDSKLAAYPIDEGRRFWIKQSSYSVEDLLGNDPIAAEYQGGTCLIFRLTVDDYHRYCYLDDGFKGKNRFIDGELHTVKPIALDTCNIYKRNCREYTVLHTAHFGDVVQVEVGAMMVGKIKNHHEAVSFQRGEEKGMFEFGGSTIVLLLKKDAAAVDQDILDNTRDQRETIVRMGQKIGVRA